MKKVISVSMILAILFTFTACSSTEYMESVVTIPVTDKDGKEVTDKDGKVVTEVVSDDADKASSASSGKKDDKQSSADTTTKKSVQTSGKKDKTTSKKAEKTTKASTSKPATTKVTTTQKSKRRDILITVNLPFYNELETELIVSYKVKGDKKWTELEKKDVILDKRGKEEKFKIKNIKGDVEIMAVFDGISSTHNTAFVQAGSDDAEVTITPVTGIEIVDGGDWG